MVLCTSHLKAIAYWLEILQFMFMCNDSLDDAYKSDFIPCKANIHLVFDNTCVLKNGSQCPGNKNGLLIASLNTSDLNGYSDDISQINAMRN